MKKFAIFAGLVFMFCSCNSSNRFAIDTSENRIEVKIHRFDKDLIELDTANLKTSVASLYKKYPDFLPVYVGEVLDTVANDTAVVADLFRQFLSDKTFAPINKKTAETFQDVSDIELKLSDAFTYIHHYFPEIRLPEIYFFVSGFNRSVIMTDKYFGFGTDYYLGSDYPPYEEFTYQYLIYNMRRECLPVDVVSAVLFRIFMHDASQDRLIDNMLFRGKVMFLMSVFMPDETSETIMGYTPEQMKWAITYEKEIWGQMIDNKDIFSTDMLLIRKYLNDSPFTAPISQDSPGRLGTWIGMEIVKSYMENNKEITLKDLMKDNNYQKMLQRSGYRP